MSHSCPITSHHIFPEREGRDAATSSLVKLLRPTTFMCPAARLFPRFRTIVLPAGKREERSSGGGKGSLSLSYSLSPWSCSSVITGCNFAKSKVTSTPSHPGARSPPLPRSLIPALSLSLSQHLRAAIKPFSVAGRVYRYDFVQIHS